MRRYSAVAITFHWLTAAAVLFQLGLAQRMEGPDTPEKFAVFQLHKSVGVTILVLTALRLAWRLSHRPPPSPVTGWEKRLSSVVHAGFYGLLVITPLAGWLTVSTSRLRLPTLLYGVIPFPDLPAPQATHAAASFGHHALAWALIALLVLHLAGALKHQFWKGDEPVIPRMAGRAPWFAILAAAAAVFAAGVLLQLPAPRMNAAASPSQALAAPALAGANWTILPGSSLTFTTAWNSQPVQGRFTRWAAAVAFDPSQPQATQIRATVDLASADTGDSQRDATLKSADWFDAAAHPVATFTADTAEKTAIGFVAHGALTLKGMSVPFDLPFTFEDGPQASITADFNLDRTQFAIGRGQASDQIPAKVALQLAIKAVRK